MDLEKLIALLKGKFKGVRPDVVEQLALIISMTAKDEEAVKQVVDGLTSTEIENFGKKFQSTLDKERTNAIKTNEENLREKFDFVEKGKNPKEKSEGGQEQGGEKEDGLKKEINELKEIVKSFSEERKRTSLLEKASKMLEEKGVDKNYSTAILAGRSFSSEEEITTFVEETEKGYSAFVEAFRQNEIKGKTPPLSGEMTDAESKAFIEAAKAYGSDEGSCSFNVKKL